MTNPGNPPRLIVNADDYGYFPCVSRGIAEAARAGAVTATGVLANGPGLDRQIPWLLECENLDVGVHLNLTSRRPLTPGMADKLPGGGFPGVFSMAGRVLSGAVGLDLVRAEWRAQIEAVLGFGLPLRFLNSHEHVHMLPGLFGLAQELACEYRIPHLRLTRVEWSGFSGVLRNGLLQAAQLSAAPKASQYMPLFVGLSRSGKLDLAYMKTLLPTLKPGVTYELMCHPGRFDPAEIADPRLLAYHAWEAELALLTSPELKGLYDEYGIRLVNYRA